MPFPSSIKYSSFYHYYPQQSDAKGLKYKDLVRFLKQDRVIRVGGEPVSTVQFLVSELLKNFSSCDFLASYLSKTTALVPAVGSGPRKDQSSLWVPLRICEELHKGGVGAHVFPCLARETQVAKSSTAKAEERPKASEHYKSIKVVGRTLPLGVESLTIVDDVVTRGATMMGMYQALTEGFPGIPILCFSLIRVASGPVERLRCPHEGDINFNGTDTFRD